MEVNVCKVEVRVIERVTWECGVVVVQNVARSGVVRRWVGMGGMGVIGRVGLRV